MPSKGYSAYSDENKTITKQIMVANTQFTDIMALSGSLDTMAQAFADVVCDDAAPRADLAQALQVFDVLDLGLSRLEVKQLLTKVDDDGSGTVSYRELVSMYLLHQGIVHSPVTADMPLTPPDFEHKGSFGRAHSRRRKRLTRVRKPRRGHLWLSCSLEMASAGYDLCVAIGAAKHLLRCSSPYVKMHLHPENASLSTSSVSATSVAAAPAAPSTGSQQAVTGAASKRKTTIKSGSHPEWNEDFTWDIPDGVDFAALRLHVSVWDKHTFSNEFKGKLSFLLQDILDMEEPAAGWFILLDDVQGSSYNFPSPQIELDGRASRSLSRSTSIQQQTSPAATKTYQHDDFDFVMVLGKGNFGKVYLGKEKATGELVALKVLKKHALSCADDVESALVERRVLLQAHGAPNMAHLLGTYTTEATLVFVLEPIMGGTLVSHMLRSKGQVLPESTVVFYSAQLCLALFFLHERGIIYRDLKLDNVMLNAAGHARLVDFGLAKDGLEPGDKAHTFCGTPHYLAPEVVEYRPYDKAVDFWSLGILVYEALVGKPLFQGEDELAIFDAILQQDMEFPASLSKTTKALFSAVLVRDPRKRLVGKAIKDHVFYRSMDWSRLTHGKIKPPIVPKLKANTDISFFDPTVAGKAPVISPTPEELLSTIDQSAFADFCDTFTPSVAPIFE